MIRNVFFFLVGLIIFGVVTLFNVNYLNYKAPMDYAHWEDINWSDFRGFNRPFFTLYGSKTFAFISTEIVVDYNPDGNTQITTYFHPSRSYVFNNNILDRSLLKHELYHFHIAEIAARRMRRDLPQKTKTKTFDLDAWQEKYQDQEDSMQLAYDYETNHGYLSGIQKKWHAKVDSSLLTLSKYSKPIVAIN